MPLQEEGDLVNYQLDKGVSKWDTEIKEYQSQELRFKKTRYATNEHPYVTSLYDPLSEVVLAEIRGTKSSAKQKTLVLYQPDLEIELKDTGKINFECRFEWENEKYFWRKRGNPFSKELECKMVHDPDPGIGVAIFQPKGQSLGVITIMYWNMDRIPVKDKKGLEYCLLTTLLSFMDEWDDNLISKAGSLVKNEKFQNDGPPLRLKHPKKEKTEIESVQYQRQDPNQISQDEEFARRLMEEEERQEREQRIRDESFAKQLMEREKEEAVKNITQQSYPPPTVPSPYAQSSPSMPSVPSAMPSSEHYLSQTISPPASEHYLPQTISPPASEHYLPQTSSSSFYPQQPPNQQYYTPTANASIPGQQPYDPQVQIPMPMPSPAPSPNSAAYFPPGYPQQPPQASNQPNQPAFGGGWH